MQNDSYLHFLVVRKLFHLIPKQSLSSDYAVFCQALSLYFACQMASALDLIKKCITVNPLCIDYIKLQAKIYFFISKFQACIKQLNIAAKIDSSDPQIQLIRAQCYQQQGKVQQAFKIRQNINSQRAIPSLLHSYRKLNKNLPPVIVDRAKFAIGNDIGLGIQLTRLLMQQRQFQIAYTILRQLEQQYSQNLQISIAVGHAQQAIGQDLDSVLKHYKKGITQDTNNYQIYTNLGNALSSTGKKTNAIQCFKKAIFLNHYKWQSHFNLGLTLFQIKQFASAFISFSAAADLCPPENSICNLYLGIVLYFLDDQKASIKYITKAVSKLQKAVNQNQATQLLQAMAILNMIGKSELLDQIKQKIQYSRQLLTKDQDILFNNLKSHKL